MLSHFRHQRNLNRRLFVAQLLLAAIVFSICFIVKMQHQGMAFALGAAIIASAHFIMASLTFTVRVQASSEWFGRFMLAMLLKWLLVVLLMLLFMQGLMVAPLMALMGIITSLLLIQLFNYFDVKVKRGS